MSDKPSTLDYTLATMFFHWCAVKTRGEPGMSTARKFISDNAPDREYPVDWDDFSLGVSFAFTVARAGADHTTPLGIDLRKNRWLVGAAERVVRGECVCYECMEAAQKKQEQAEGSAAGPNTIYLLHPEGTVPLDGSLLDFLADELKEPPE